MSLRKEFISAYLLIIIVPLFSVAILNFTNTGKSVALLTFGILFFLCVWIALNMVAKSVEEDVNAKEIELMKKLEESNRVLAQAKAKDESMLLGIGDGLVATGKDGNIVFVNRVFTEMLGWKEEEVQFKMISQIIPMLDEKGKPIAESERPITQLLQKRLKTTTSSNVLWYQRKDGTSFPVASIVSPIIIDGDIFGAIELFRDITKEREIDKEKTEFVSLASHQLRTPLSTINWYIEMLLSGDAGKVTDEQKKYLEEVYAGNQRMVELVNSLLNVSRLELGTFIIEPEPIDIVALAHSVIDEQKPQIDAKKLNLKSTFGKDISIISADKKLLRMVFQNLISNSVKYTPEGGNIELEIIPHERNITLRFSDTGYGIPKRQQKEIFKKLFRADNVKAKDTEGTGLGLYIIQSIVEKSGGTIWFESEENKGTTFFITLPIGEIKKNTGEK